MAPAILLGVTPSLLSEAATWTHAEPFTKISGPGLRAGTGLARDTLKNVGSQTIPQQRNVTSIVSSTPHGKPMGTSIMIPSLKMENENSGDLPKF